MSQLSPTKLLELFKEKKINKSEFINRILTIYEFSDSKETRIDCLRTFDSENIKNEKIFKFLEEVVISDPDIDVRLNAINLALKKYPENGYNLVNYIFNSSESMEFVVRIAKMIGETIISSDYNITIELSNSLKSIVLTIFKKQDVRSFEILWGDWFYNMPEDYWDFLLDLREPIGFLEIMDYYISDLKIYNWLFDYILAKVNFDQWILFLNNSQFSGRLLYILFFLIEETPPARFYELIDLFTHKGQNLTSSQLNQIRNLIKRNNQYTLLLILAFQWLNYFSIKDIKEIFEDSDLKLIFKITELIKNKKFAILNHDYFFYSILCFLLKISKEIDDKYVVHFFEGISHEIRRNFVSKLDSIVKYEGINERSEIENSYTINFKEVSSEFLKILSKYYEIELTNS